jgi:ubiquinone/menaquinone biosynthesis C-methylase UbiE
LKPSTGIQNGLRGVYERQATTWDIQRSRALFERGWLDRLLAFTRPGNTILDIGCGTGDPIARYVIDKGRNVCGVDFAASMLEIARTRFPNARWMLADMRDLDLGETFGAVIAWDSFFHLSADEQRQVLPRLAAHVSPGGAMLVTAGPKEGEAWGEVGGEPVFHASLSIEEYTRILASAGLRIEAFVPDDPTCAGHSVLLAASTR